MSWRARARCAELVQSGEADVSWWFPEHGDFDAGRRAKAVCAACPVTKECAYEGNAKEGIWGGLSIKERRALYGPRYECRRCAAPLDHPNRRWCDDCGADVRAEQHAQSKKWRAS